jgi:hypothetical protein
MTGGARAKPERVEAALRHLRLDLGLDPLELEVGPVCQAGDVPRARGVQIRR